MVESGMEIITSAYHGEINLNFVLDVATEGTKSRKRDMHVEKRRGGQHLDEPWDQRLQRRKTSMITEAVCGRKKEESKREGDMRLICCSSMCD
jgi:hypothetical protein